jgi:hypothetical protein
MQHTEGGAGQVSDSAASLRLARGAGGAAATPKLDSPSQSAQRQSSSNLHFLQNGRDDEGLEGLADAPGTEGCQQWQPSGQARAWRPAWRPGTRPGSRVALIMTERQHAYRCAWSPAQLVQPCFGGGCSFCIALLAQVAPAWADEVHGCNLAGLADLFVLDAGRRRIVTLVRPAGAAGSADPGQPLQERGSVSCGGDGAQVQGWQLLSPPPPPCQGWQ